MMKTPSPPKKRRVKRDNICEIGSSPALRKTCKMEKTEIKFIQKKMQSPTKKITRSPHLPTAKKNIQPPHKKSPAKKKTPAMNTSPATKIQEGNGSKVKMARMKIEEKIRKEKRAKLIDQIRKPLLNTPGTPGSKGQGMLKRFGKKAKMIELNCQDCQPSQKMGVGTQPCAWVG